VALGQTNSTNVTNPDLIVARRELAPFLVRAAIRELGGITRYVKPGDMVTIKPNFSWDCMPNSAANAANTDPEVVKAVVELCLEAGASEIKIVDNTLTNPPELGLRSSQIEGKLSKYDQVVCKTLNGKGDEFQRVSVGKTVGELGVSRDVLSADVFINIPKVKNHYESAISISMKNLMGIIDDRDLLHNRGLHRSIAELNGYLQESQSRSGQRNLVVADAIRTLQTGGPGGPGKVVRLDCVLAGDNPVVVDAYGCDLIEVPISEAQHVELASREYGLGEIEDLQTKELDVSMMSKDDLLPNIPAPDPRDGRGESNLLIPLGLGAAGLFAAGVIVARRMKRAG
jgi:uncharacterized protein (DUF362 family)